MKDLKFPVVSGKVLKNQGTPGAPKILTNLLKENALGWVNQARGTSAAAKQARGPSAAARQTKKNLGA